MSAVSGVFSSCEAMEMNSSRARIAARRSASAAANVSMLIAVTAMYPCTSNRRSCGDSVPKIPLPATAPDTAITDTSRSAEVTPRCSNRSAAQISNGTVG